jgi:hypothetical protein
VTSTRPTALIATRREQRRDRGTVERAEVPDEEGGRVGREDLEEVPHVAPVVVEVAHVEVHPRRGAEHRAAQQVADERGPAGDDHERAGRMARERLHGAPDAGDGGEVQRRVHEHVGGERRERRAWSFASRSRASSLVGQSRSLRPEARSPASPRPAMIRVPNFRRKCAAPPAWSACPWVSTMARSRAGSRPAARRSASSASALASWPLSTIRSDPSEPCRRWAFAHPRRNVVTSAPSTAVRRGRSRRRPTTGPGAAGRVSVRRM